MGRLRVLDCYKQLKQHSNNDELVQFDVEYLLKCIGKERGTCYNIIDRPDTRDRQSPQPDYLIENSKTGDLMTIEHARLFESEEQEERKGNLVKKYPDIVHRWWINAPTPEELGKRLSEFVSKKLSKGQFKSFGHTERILLTIDLWGGTSIRTLIQAESYFRLPEIVDCDHFYLILIADPVLVEVF